MLNADDIQREHDRLGCRLGWKFLYSPERTLRTADVALITLNPGGENYEGPQWSYEDGNAYVTQAWGKRAPGTHVLQRQVQIMFDLLGVEPDGALSAVYVPFRSPRWSALPRHKEAVAFARLLWRGVFDRHAPSIVVCVGKNVVGREIADLLGAKPAGAVEARWGAQTIDQFEFNGGRIVELPHLSTFKLFGRLASDRAFLRAVSG